MNHDHLLEAQALAMTQDAIESARRGDAGRLTELLTQGVPVDIRTPKGDSLLMLASYHGHAKAAAVLLSQGADAELANDRGQTPLQGVAFKGDLQMARLLLDGGVQVDGGGADRKTPLMFAAMFNRSELVQELIARGASTIRQDQSGNTALGLARSMGAADATRLLETWVGKAA